MFNPKPQRRGTPYLLLDIHNRIRARKQVARLRKVFSRMTKTVGEMRRHMLRCEALGFGGSRVVGREGVVCVDELVGLWGEGGGGAGGLRTVGVLSDRPKWRPISESISHASKVLLPSGTYRERFLYIYIYIYWWFNVPQTIFSGLVRFLK